jgi:hypothetical protein
MNGDKGCRTARPLGFTHLGSEAFRKWKMEKKKKKKKKSVKLRKQKKTHII